MFTARLMNGHRAQEGLPEQWVVEQQVDIVLQADELDIVWRGQVEVREAQVERIDHRKADDQHDDEHAGQQQSKGQIAVL